MENSFERLRNCVACGIFNGHNVDMNIGWLFYEENVSDKNT